jgi:WD40 repeat protein
MIVTSQDRRVRVFDYDEVCCASASAHAWVTQKSSRVRLTLRIGHGDLIYDTCWLPAVGEASFASTSRCAPIHLWSACDGRRIATYRGINHLDEMASAYSVLATADGRQLVGGYKKCLRVFDVSACSNLSN